MKLSQRTRDRLSTAAVVAGVALFTGLVAWGLTWGKPAPAKPAAPAPVVVTQTLPVQAWTTVTATATETVVATETPAPVTVTETVTATETATVTETVEVAAGLGGPNQGVDTTPGWDLPAGWYFVPGLEASTGMWARTSFDGTDVQVDPDMPVGIRAYAIAHETGHVRQAQVFGNVTATPGNYERVADCYAQLQGFSPSVYGCDSASMEIARTL